jgi:hypothetical protein
MAKVKVTIDGRRYGIEVPDDIVGDKALLETYIDQAASEIQKAESPTEHKRSLGEAEEPDDRSFFDKAGDALKTAGAIASGTFASSAGGLATGKRLIESALDSDFEGIGAPTLPAAAGMLGSRLAMLASGRAGVQEEGSGKFFWEDELADAVARGQAVQDRLTYTPESQGARDNLQAISDSIVGDAGRAYDSATDTLADKALEYTGWPVAAGVAKGAPDLALEMLGLGTVKRAGQAARHVNRPELQTLREAGVKPTVGQTIGGVAKAIEDKAVGVAPGARDAQNRVGEQWQNGVINTAMEPLGVKVQGTGVEAIEQAQKALDDAYDAARDLLPELEIKGTTLAQDMAEQLGETAGSVGPDVMSPIKNTYKDLIKPILGKDKISSSDLQKLESKLNDRIAKASSKGNMDLVVEYRQFLQILREQAAKQSPEYAAQVNKANKAYSMFADVEIAAGRAGGDAGTFTPAQLQSAVKQGTSRRARARGGDGPIADLAKAGNSQLSPVTGNSGTVERGAQTAAAVGGYAVDPLFAGGMLGSMLGSTRAGQALGRAGVQIAAPTLPAAAGVGMMAAPLVAAKSKEKK